jgi:hypothetical protein
VRRRATSVQRSCIRVRRSFRVRDLANKGKAWLRYLFLGLLYGRPRFYSSVFCTAGPGFVRLSSVRQDRVLFVCLLYGRPGFCSSVFCTAGPGFVRLSSVRKARVLFVCLLYGRTGFCSSVFCTEGPGFIRLSSVQAPLWRRDACSKHHGEKIGLRR